MRAFGDYHVRVISFLKQMVAFPVRMAAETASLLSFVDATGLWSACYKLSGEAQDACRVLGGWFGKHGLPATRELAEEMLERTADCEIAAMMVWIEYALLQEWPAVTYWIKLAKRRDYKKPQMLLRMELLLADFLEDYDEYELMEQILARNDLPGEWTTTALTSKAHFLMERGRWNEAEALANRILAIEDHAGANLIKWTVCLSREEDVEATMHLAAAQKKLSPHSIGVHLALGWWRLGRVDKAMEYLCKCDLDKYRVREWRGPLGELARSAEFAAYCAGRPK